MRYDQAPPWDPSRCDAPGLKPGAVALGRQLRQRFGAVVRVGGYNCRPNTASPDLMSMHGTGRAIDVMIDPARAAQGDAIANWLVENASTYGVQLVIWKRTKWNGSFHGRKDEPYFGPNAHLDHLHVELNDDGARKGGGVLWVVLAGLGGGLAARWWRRRRG